MTEKKNTSLVVMGALAHACNAALPEKSKMASMGAPKGLTRSGKGFIDGG